MTHWDYTVCLLLWLLRKPVCKEGSGVPAAGSQLWGPGAQWPTHKQEPLGGLHGYHCRGSWDRSFIYFFVWLCWVFIVMHRLSLPAFLLWASLVFQSVKNLPALQETWVRSPGWEDPLEKKMATHSSILAWRISWTEEPGGLQSMGSQRVGHAWVTNTYLLTYFSCGEQGLLFVANHGLLTSLVSLVEHRLLAPQLQGLHTQARGS